MDILSLLISMTIKSTIILLVVFAVTGLVKRLSSSERHLIWCLAFLCLALLPVLTFIVPKYRFTGPMAGYMEFLNVDLSSISLQSPIPAIDATRSDPDGIVAIMATVGQWDAATAVSIIYWLMLSACLSYLGFVYFRIKRSLKPLNRVGETEILRQVKEIRLVLGINRDVQVLQSESDMTPWTWGILRPSIILPIHFNDWSGEQQWNALVHELSHIKRYDLISFLLVRVCCCLYCFHPLAWIGYWKMVTEAEKACDDRVLLNGSKASFYATQLIDIANSIYHGHRQQPMVAAMARCSSLSSRVRNILDGELSRNLVRKHVLTLTVAVALALSISLVAGETNTENPEQGNVFTADNGKANEENHDTADGRDDASSREFPTASAMRETVYKILSEIQEVVEDHKYEQGLSMLKELDERTGLNSYERAQVQNFLAYTYFAMDRYDDAIQSYKNVLQQMDIPKALKLNSIYTLAQLYLIQQDYVEAIASMNQWVELNNKPTVDSYLIMAQAYYNLEQYKNALIPLQKAYDLVKVTGKKPNPGLLQLLRAVYLKLEDKENFNRASEELKQLYPKIAENQNPELASGKSGLGLSPSDGDYLPIVKVAPVYPKRALARKLEGYVVVEFTVSKRGTTRDIKVVEAQPLGIFNQSAIQAAEKFKYKPRVVDGEPVEVHGVRNLIKFALNDEKKVD